MAKKYRSRKRKRGVSKKLVIPKRSRGYLRTSGLYGRGNELKFHDHVQTTTTLLEAGIVHTSLNLIPQGTAANQRIGRAVVVRKIDIRGEFNLVRGSAELNTGIRVRMIVFLDQQCNGTNAVTSDLLAASTGQLIDDPANLTNVHRFVWLSDKTYTLNSPTMIVNAAPNVTVRSVHSLEFHKTCEVPLEFSGVTGVITEIRSNNLAVFTIVNTSGGGSQLSHMRFHSQIRYSDE